MHALLIIIFLPIACKSWHPIFSPRGTATKENVEKNQNQSQKSTNADSQIEICVIRMLVGWLVIFRVIIEVFSIHGRVVFKEVRWLVTHFTRKKIELYQNQDGRSWSTHSRSFQVTGKNQAVAVCSTQALSTTPQQATPEQCTVPARENYTWLAAGIECYENTITGVVLYLSPKYLS